AGGLAFLPSGVLAFFAIAPWAASAIPSAIAVTRPKFIAPPHLLRPPSRGPAQSQWPAPPGLQREGARKSSLPGAPCSGRLRRTAPGPPACVLPQGRDPPNGSPRAPL